MRVQEKQPNRDVNSEESQTSPERQVLEQAINAVVSIDEKNIVTFFNAAAEELWGYSAEEVVGKNVAMLVPLELQAGHDDLVNANRTTGVDKIVGTSREVPVHRKDGTVRQGRLSLSKVPLNGKITYTAFVIDVTEEVRSREEVLQTFEQAVDAVVAIDADNIVTRFNPAAEELWGYSAEEVIGQNVRMLVPQAIQANHDDFVNANRSTGIDKIVGTSREVEVHRKNGEMRWGKLSLSKIEVGGSISYTAFVQDVTEEVGRREEILQTFEQAVDAVVAIDADNIVTRFNPAAEELWGYSGRGSDRPERSHAGATGDSGQSRRFCERQPQYRY